MLQVPVQRLQVLGGLQHHVPEPLHLRRRARRALRRVGPRELAWPTLKVSGSWPGSAGRSCVSATTRTAGPLGSTRSTPTPPRLSGSGRGGRTGGVGQPQHVDLVGGPERGADEPRPGAPAEQHARRTRRRYRAAAARPGCAARCVKPKARANASARSRSGFSNSSQARSCTLMTGFSRPAGVLARQSRPARCADRCAGRAGRSSTAPLRC